MRSALWGRGAAWYHLPERWGEEGEGMGSWQYRARASRGQAYARLFSEQGLSSLVARAPVEALQQVSAGASVVMPGYAVDGGRFELDLGVAGSALPGALLSERQAVLVLSAGSGRLSLKGVGTRTDQPPLLLCVVGTGNPVPALELDSVQRPVVLVAEGVRLKASRPVSWNGVLVLGPRASFEEGSAHIRSAHVSLPAGLRCPAFVTPDLPWEERVSVFDPGWACAVLSPGREEDL
jgi:hypothetical protein